MSLRAYVAGISRNSNIDFIGFFVRSNQQTLIDRGVLPLVSCSLGFPLIT
jgi:hypothetical protein